MRRFYQSVGFHIPLLAGRGHSDNDAEKTNLSTVMETLKNSNLCVAEVINFLPICRLAHFLPYQPICHDAKAATSSPIDQQALMMVQNTSNSVFIRSPFQCARAKVLKAIILIPMGYRRNSVDAPKSLSAFEKKNRPQTTLRGEVAAGEHALKSSAIPTPSVLLHSSASLGHLACGCDSVGNCIQIAGEPIVTLSSSRQCC